MFMFMDQHFSFMPTNYLRSGLIESVSPKLGDIRCDWKNRLLSLWPNELFIFGAGSLKWLNGSDTLNIFVWLFGLKLFSELPGMFTGADVPCKIPATVMRILMGYSDCAIDRLSQRDSLSLELITLDPVLERGHHQSLNISSSKLTTLRIHLMSKAIINSKILFIWYWMNDRMSVYLPEMEFDNWDPGILSGVVELCIKLDNSSKFAVNWWKWEMKLVFYVIWYAIIVSEGYFGWWFLQNLSNDPMFCILNVKHILFRCSFSCGQISGSFSMAKSCIK